MLAGYLCKYPRGFPIKYYFCYHQDDLRHVLEVILCYPVLFNQLNRIEYYFTKKTSEKYEHKNNIHIYM